MERQINDDEVTDKWFDGQVDKQTEEQTDKYMV